MVPLHMSDLAVQQHYLVVDQVSNPSLPRIEAQALLQFVHIELNGAFVGMLRLVINSGRVW